MTYTRPSLKQRVLGAVPFLYTRVGNKGSGPQAEVAWQLDEIRASIEFIAENGPEAGAKAATAVAQIFAKSKDNEIRRTCLYSLSQIKNDKAHFGAIADLTIPRSGADLAGSGLRIPRPKNHS